MITNTSLAVIGDQASLVKACHDVVFQVRTFSLNVVDLNALFDVEVRGQILPIPAISILDRAVFLAYVDGFQSSLIHSIRTTECEFVYRSSLGVLFSTKVGIKDRPHFSNMTMRERETATTGYAWLGTGMQFTTFTRDQSLRIAA